MQKALVKLPYSAQKVLLRATIFILFFVLIFTQIDCIEYRLGCKELTALKEAKLKDPRYRQNKRFHEFLYLKDHTASLKEKKKASKASGGLPGAPFQKEGGKKSSGGSANTSRASTPVSERSFKVTGSSSKKSLGKI